LLHIKANTELKTVFFLKLRASKLRRASHPRSFLFFVRLFRTWTNYCNRSAVEQQPGEQQDNQV